MKLLYNNKLYVQKIDLIYLYNYYAKLPDFILIKILKECININDENKFDLVEFDRKKELIFFDNLEYILDYNLVKDLKYDEKEKMCSQILDKTYVIENEIKKLSVNSLNYNILIKQWELYNYMYYSLNYLSIDNDSIKKLIKK